VRRQQYPPRTRIAGRDEGVPRRVPMHAHPLGIIEQRAPQAPVIEDETERLDQIRRDPKTGGETQ